MGVGLYSMTQENRLMAYVEDETMETMPDGRAGRSRWNSSPSGKAGEIARELEHRLMLGVYRFGDSLTISQLAQQFNASRQPVSMAISHLRSIGYVDVIPQVGCRVVSPSPAEITDFFLVMGKMEGAVASFAARRHRGDEAETLLAIAARDAPRILETAAERIAYITNVNDFHAQIWSMARSSTLEGRVARLRQLSIFYLWQGAPKMTLISALQLIEERREIAGLIAAGDADQAERLMEAHIGHKPFVTGVV
jgi:DNA-binding GntR family transcriptional regulator